MIRPPSLRRSLPLILGGLTLAGGSIVLALRPSQPAQKVEVRAMAGHPERSRPGAAGNPASPSFSSADEIPPRRENASEADFPIPRGSLPGKASARPFATTAAVAPAGVNAFTGAPSSPPAFAAAGSSQVPVSAAHPGGRTGPRRNHPLDAESASSPGGSAGQQPAPFQRPSALPLSHAVTDEQVQQIAPDVPPQTIVKIREQFEQEAGIADLAPDDPEYQRRWQIAEPTAADRMRTLYGWAAYGEFVRQAALAAQH